MQAEIDVLILPYDSARQQSVLDLLIRELRSKKWNEFFAAVAFAKQSGNVGELVQAIADFCRRGGNTMLTFGADVFSGESRGSEQLAIETLLTSVPPGPNFKVHLYHEKGRTFHPKLYLFANMRKQRALLIVGSSNWSEGGLFNNIEANVVVRLILSKRDHAKTFNKTKKIFTDYWMEAE